MATLSEFDSRELLASAGVPVSQARNCHTAADAATAATEIGFPVVVKLCGAAIAHKTERRLVRLGLTSAPDVAAAAGELLALARPDDGAVSVLVSEFVKGQRELIAGLVRDEQFGPCVMVGIGGIFAEALGDVAFRLAPLTALDAEEMLDDLEHQALLGPFRGEPAVDRSDLTAVLLALSHLGAERDDIASIDINPLIVREGRVIAVDALVETARTASTTEVAR